MDIDFFKARSSSEYRIGDAYRRYAINDSWKSNAALWGLIDSMAGEPASKLYARIVDMVKNVSDVELCDMKQLESMSYQFGMSDGFGFLDSLPTSVYDLMNVLSIRQNKFMEKGQVFSESGVKEIIDRLPEAVVEVSGSSDSTVISAVTDLLRSSMEDYGKPQEVIDQVVLNVSSSGSLSDGLRNSESIGLISSEDREFLTSDTLSRLLKNGTISFPDYASRAVMGSSFGGYESVNVDSPIEFVDTYEDGVRGRRFIINQMVRNATDADVSLFLESNPEFSLSIADVTREKLHSMVESSTMSESSKSAILGCDATYDGFRWSDSVAANVMYWAMDSGSVPMEDLNVLASMLSSLSPYDVLECKWQEESGRDSLIQKLVDVGFMSEDSSSEFAESASSDGIVETVKNYVRTGLAVSSAPLEDRTINFLYRSVQFIGRYGSIDLYGAEEENSSGLMMFHGFIPGEVAGEISSPAGITEEMIRDQRSSITSSFAGQVQKKSIECRPGGWLYVALPHTSEHRYTSRRYDGVGGLADFSSSVVDGIDGMNGESTVDIGGKTYDVYGEFVAATSQFSYTIVDNVPRYSGVKLGRGYNSMLSFDGESWVVFRNMIGRYPGMMASSTSTPSDGSVSIISSPWSSLKLPAGTSGNLSMKIGLSVRLPESRKFLSCTAFIEEVVRKSYADLIRKVLSCVVGAGNADDVSIYEEDFRRYVGDDGFRQYVNDRNVNGQFLDALEMSNFCSNLCSSWSLDGDWFLDSDIHSDDVEPISSDDVIREVSDVLTDMTLAVTMRRMAIRMASRQYSSIGSSSNTEKIVGDYVLRNFTKRSSDWMLSSVEASRNDSVLPSMESIRDRFEVNVKEYFDTTEYLNISAESGKKVERKKRQIEKIQATIDANGEIATSKIYIDEYYDEQTNEPAIEGGNEPFWKMKDYQSSIASIGDDVVKFYQNVDGGTSVGNLGSVESIKDVFSRMWEYCAVSSLIDENVDMHRKYIGDGTGYATALNVGNENYPTIAPIPTLANLTEYIGSMERDYQSIVNDDRPDVVEGVTPRIVDAYYYVPLASGDVGTDVVASGLPPYLSYPAEDYAYNVTSYVPKTVTGYNEIVVPGAEMREVVEQVEVERQQTIVNVIESYRPVTMNDYGNGNFVAGLPPKIPEEYDVDDFVLTVYVPQTSSVTYASIGGNEVRNGVIGVTSGYVSGTVAIGGGSAEMNDAVLNIVDHDYDPYEGYNAYDEIATMKARFDSFSPTYGGTAGDLDPYVGEFPSISSKILAVTVPWLDDNIYSDDLKTFVDGTTIVSSDSDEGFTYRPSDWCIVNEDVTPPVNVSTFSQVFSYIDANLPVLIPHLSPDVASKVNAIDVAIRDGNIVVDYGDDTAKWIVSNFYKGISSSLKNLNSRDDVSSISSGLASMFPLITASSTVEEYESFRSMVDFENEKAVFVQHVLTSDSEDVVIRSGLLHEYTVQELSEYCSNIFDRIDRTSDSIELDVSTKTFTSMVPSSFNAYGVDTETVRTVSSWTETVETTRMEPVHSEDVVNAYYEYVEMVPVVEKAYAYKILTPEQYAQYTGGDWIHDQYVTYATVDMFDGFGGLKNSWRNVNVELRGYNSCYEASPNLDTKYSENKYVDVDGPWIGEALYDFLASIIPDSGASGSVDQDLKEPDPSMTDPQTLKKDHYYSEDNGVKDGKWWLPQYVDDMSGVEMDKQIKFYAGEIVGCRNRSVSEVEVDSFGNHYTLFKDRNDDGYDSEGVLWMRHSNHPYSFPILQKYKDGWEDSSNVLTDSISVNGMTLQFTGEDAGGFAWSSGDFTVVTPSRHPDVYSTAFVASLDGGDPVMVESVDFKDPQESLGNLIDQVFVGYAVPEHRTIVNRCITFGVNNTSIWVAGYDGKNPDGSDHFNVRILQAKYFTMDGRKFFGNRSPRMMNSLNGSPSGYDSENLTPYVDGEKYSWKDFCGGYYDGNLINFVFWGSSGFRFRTYNLITGRLNSDDVIAAFPEESYAMDYAPTIVDGHNPFRLVEDDGYCYVAWTSGNLFVVCKCDKDNYRFENILSWRIPESEPLREVRSFAAGSEVVKVMMKSGNVYYARLSSSGFGSNEGTEELLPEDMVKFHYVNDEEDGDAGVEEYDFTKIPRIPTIDLTQWRQWAYTLTECSLLSPSYADSMNVESMTSSMVNVSGYHYDIMSKRVYVPGNMVVQPIVSYRPDSGVLNVNGATILTGYDIGEQYEELTPALQQVIPAYGARIQSGKIEPFEHVEDAARHFYSEMSMMDSYYGLPYNSLYVERTDMVANRKNLDAVDGEIGTEYNFLTLKNFYSYDYEHEYSWNNRIAVTDPAFSHKVIGWRKYLKCSISRYSDSMWMSYRYIRDYTVMPNSNRQAAVSKVMNDFDFVEVVYGTIQLMNNNYSKSNVFSIEINDSKLGKDVAGDGEDARTMRRNVRNQIEQDVRAMMEKYSPIHTQLFRVKFND